MKKMSKVQRIKKATALHTSHTVAFEEKPSVPSSSKTAANVSMNTASIAERKKHSHAARRAKYTVQRTQASRIPASHNTQRKSAGMVLCGFNAFWSSTQRKRKPAGPGKTCFHKALRVSFSLCAKVAVVGDLN